MRIDDSIIKSYLSGKDDYRHHWLFYTILDSGDYAFDPPKDEAREAVNELYVKMAEALQNFTPYNEELFSALFPGWKALIQDVNIILAVGCPDPYDAMVRAHDGKEYIILDLVRFLGYGKSGDALVSLIRGLITHEAAHVCIHTDHPVARGSYGEKLSYITFDEGFAHLLAVCDGIRAYDFQAMIDAHYQNSVQKLKQAFSETDTAKQNEFLEMSNSGAYWDKFAAISGKLYLASRLGDLLDIYKAGPSAMLSDMLGVG